MATLEREVSGGCGFWQHRMPHTRKRFCECNGNVGGNREGGGLSHVKNDRQRRRESAAVTERDGNVQGDNFDAHGTVAMADNAGARGQARSPRHDDAVPFFESHQEQVVQAS